ncbi:hypothetical protein AZE42_12949 [Rhizopogon vesiculosus]|uniref:Uncharacterized protein n=1 Tax=Rhizopogon vesiculosus TaxID=180088 RepID=A0A1J8QGY0_9AGAM|nr:hypothetical protein AZE42_12949 [Rhizopogon vesiculosus]
MLDGLAATKQLVGWSC